MQRVIRRVDVECGHCLPLSMVGYKQDGSDCFAVGICKV